MARRNLFVGFVAGVLAGVVATITLMGGRTIPRAMAQDVQPRVLLPPQEPAPALVPPPQAQPIPAEAVPPPPAATPRYQISTWAHPGGPGENAGHGAYILDALSGEVWQIEGNRRPRSVTKVGKVPE